MNYIKIFARGIQLRFATFTSNIAFSVFRVLALKGTVSNERVRACFCNFLCCIARQEKASIKYRRLIKQNFNKPLLSINNKLGSVVITPLAERQLTQVDITLAIERHRNGDWGDLNDYDWVQNNMCFQQEKSRIISQYHGFNNAIFLIITEYDHSVTTILMEEEY